MKTNNIRTCIVTRKKENRINLIRLVIIDNELKIDLYNNLLGRGFYLSKDKQIINKVINGKILEKKVKANISKDTYEKLAKFI